MTSIIKVTENFSYNADAPEYRPRLKRDHPYRTMTRFMRDPFGAFIRDEDGFMVPLPTQADSVIERRREMADRLVAKRSASLRAEQERRAMAKERRRINKRQGIGDPACEQSRDEDFPLLAVLRRDGLVDAIRAVIAYRRLVAVCIAEPLKGVSYSNREAIGLSIEHRSMLRDGSEEVDAAKKMGWKGDVVPGGEIEYRVEAKRSQGAYSIAPKRKKPIDVDAYFEGENGNSNVGHTESLHIKVTEDVLIERIDQYPLLMQVRAALGPLVDAFDDAVIGGQTLGSIGERAGFKGRDAKSAGKALVMRAITVAEGILNVKKHTAANDNRLRSLGKSA